jgi:hypothetical protein
MSSFVSSNDSNFTLDKVKTEYVKTGSSALV